MDSANLIRAMTRFGGILALLLVALPAAARSASPTPRDGDVLNREVFFKSAEAARLARDYYGSYDDPEQLERVTNLGFQVAQQSSFSDYPFSFFLVDMPIPNAFALPGGQIFVTRGMLDLGLTDDMLAGLLGHEIGHVVLQHGTKMQRRATLLNVLSQALLVGVLVSTTNDRRDTGPAPPVPYGTSSGDGNRVQGAAAAGIVVSELLMRSYSREFEDQADDEGLRLAAGAGFDPAGFGELMSLMDTRMPQSNEYGYWNTHPFFESRVRAASVRKDLLARNEPEDAAKYRQQTQVRMLELGRGARGKDSEEATRFLEDAAVAIWPHGPEAHGIILDRLHAVRDDELENTTLYRDFGKLLAEYEKTLERFETADDASALIAKLEAEIASFRNSLAEAYPRAVEVFAGGIFETDFLETFVSNYPETEELAGVALALGEAYARLRRPDEAVTMLLRSFRAAPQSETGQKAARGLRALAPTLIELGALQELAELTEDQELSELAFERLGKTASLFEHLGNGAGYLAKYPDSRFRETVNDRLNELAEDLYGEAILYQNIGDHAKALDRIQSILTDAPLSPAAARLRASAVLES